MARRTSERKRRGSAKPPPSRARRWAFGLITLAIAPLFLALLEGGLRLAGAGHPTGFLVEDEVAGRAVLRDNPHFARRFFPPPLHRSPRPFTVARVKAPSAYRVLVLGESAALGDPGPAFGFARILGVMLQERYPERRVEVVNTAVTAINSHAIREIAADCARLEPDLFLIYMGNNEVVGPYGAGTAFHPFTHRLGAVRAQLLAKRLRLGQLADQWSRGLRRAQGPERWEGMAMFLGHEVRAGDPGLATVRAHFRRNLDDILAVAESAGAKVLLSTIATNLKDQAPFASKGEYADAAFARGHDLEAQGQHDDAYREFVRARDLDTLRFRADSAVNDTIRELAQARRARGVILLDTEASFRRASPHGIPGDELLFEHVHLTFEGNYLVAREALDAIAAVLPPAEGTPALGPAECARRLGLTPWHRHQLLREVIDRVRRPPFTGQPGAAERLAGLEAQAKELRPLLTASGLAVAIQDLEPTAERSRDWELHENLAELLDAAGRTEDAIREWRRVLEAVPHNHEARGRLGVLLFKAGRPDEALASFEQARRLRPDVADVHNNLGALYGGQSRWAEAERAYRHALELDPHSHEALINLAAALASQGRRDEAQQLNRQAANRPIYSAQTRYQLGLLAETLGLSAEVEAHWRAALEIEPSAPVHRALAERLEAADRLDDAAGQYRQALALDPTLPGVHAGLAWILATAPDPRQRDGAQAVTLAEEACRATANRDPEALNALAAAYAEARRFEDAQATARQAMEAARASGQPELAADIRKLANLYAQRRAYPLARGQPTPR